MNEYFAMHSDDPHNIFFAARMGFLALSLGAILILSIVSTLLFLGWREHKRYVKHEREARREQHVKALMEAAKTNDKLLYSAQSCTQTMPDMYGDQRIVEEAFREFR